jgi:hypothetical protein
MLYPISFTASAVATQCVIEIECRACAGKK